MKSTKSTLTTIAIAAGLALGGIAVAQTTMDSSGSMNSGDTATMQAQPGTDLGTSATTDTSILGNSSDTSLNSDSSLQLDEPVAQVDRG